MNDLTDSEKQKLAEYKQSCRVIKSLLDQLNNKKQSLDYTDKISCPISLNVMIIPVIVKTRVNNKEHMHYFDLTSLYGALGLSLSGKHPLTNVPIKKSDIFPAPEKRDEIVRFLTENLEKTENPKINIRRS